MPFRLASYPRLCTCAFVILLLVSSSYVSAQAPPPPGLRSVIAALDQRLFTAYNTCDLKTLATMVSEDLEFYHDKTGLAVGRPVFLESIRNNICGKVQRTLDPASLEVYPLDHYGAVEMGSHHFSHPGRDTDQGEAKFVMLWQNTNGTWKLTRVIS